MRRLMKSLRLYKDFAVISIRSELTHMNAFIAGIIGQWLNYGAVFLSLYVIVDSFDVLGGWNKAELLLMYAFSLFTYALSATIFFNPASQLGLKVRTGELDAALCKPMNPLLSEIYVGFNFGYVSHIIISVIIMIWSVKSLQLTWSFYKAIMFLILIVCSVLLQSAFLLISSSFSFVMINENPVMSFVLFDIKQFVNYPVKIYHFVIQTILIFVIPYAFIGFYPVAYILDKKQLTVYPDWLQFFTPLVSILLFSLGIKLWNRGFSRYESSGS